MATKKKTSKRVLKQKGEECVVFEPRGIIRLPRANRPPELLIQEMPTAGIHNGAIGQTISRLDKSKSWKRQRIIVLLPTAELISAKVALSHWNLQFPPNNGVARLLAVGMEVGEAYSTAIEQILLHPELSTWEYILTIEHDMMPPSDGVLQLLECIEEHPELDAISGGYFTRGYGGQAGGVFQAWGDPKDFSPLNFRPQLPDLNGGLTFCNGIGMGFALWRLKIFKDKKLRRPWFVTQKKDGICTQDLYFASDACKHGYRFAVLSACKVGHYSIEEDFVY